MTRMRIFFYLHAIILLVFYACFNSSAWAGCSITSAGATPAEVTFTIPPIVVSSDAEPWTILYSQHLNSAAIKVKCSAKGNIYQGYTVLSDADLVTNSALEKVYATNIPGIGFRAGWGNNTSSPLSSGNLISPWHLGSSTVNPGDGTYPITLNAGIELVVTGPIGSGLLDTSKLVADWKYDDIVIGQLRFTATSINVQANTCNLAEKNITVPLSSMTTSEFNSNFSDIVSDSRFQIQLEQCAANVQVDYKFTTSGSTGVSNGHTLNIASGSEAAEGVGIQILDSNNSILLFDKDYTAVAKTTENQSVYIPLKARYIKTGAIKGGDVNAVATFEVSYR